MEQNLMNVLSFVLSRPSSAATLWVIAKNVSFKVPPFLFFSTINVESLSAGCAEYLFALER